MARKLDIEYQFRAHAQHLLSKVDAGKKVHSTANIAESGSPLEMSVRRLFAEALPESITVAPGYFFNGELSLSMQIDALFCDRSEMLYLPPTDELAQRYIPYNSVRAMAQVKNSAGNLKGALKQIASALSSWRAMRKGDSAIAPPSGELAEPLAVVIIGRGGSKSKVRKVLKASKQPLPAYVLLLEKGLLYGKDSTLRFVTDLKSVSFAAQGNDGPLTLLEVDGNAKAKAGKLLMWVFFALFFHLKSARAGLTFEALLKKVEMDFRVRYAKQTTSKKSSKH
jgi:hypothetical protein